MRRIWELDEYMLLSLRNNFLTERIVYFLNTVHCYNILEEYYYYEIQIHKALCDFAEDFLIRVIVG